MKAATKKNQIIIRKISAENKQVCDLYKVAKKSEKSLIAIDAMTREVYNYINFTQASAATSFITACLKANVLTQHELEKLACHNKDVKAKMLSLIVKYDVRFYEKTTNRCMSHIEVCNRIERHVTSDTAKKMMKRIA